MERTIDTLPPAERDETLEYAGYHRAPSHCRFRLYHTPAQVPVIVLTETEDNAGTSITNAAERCHFRAWEQIGKPWPVVFVEHYPGWNGAVSRPLDAEHLDEVTFHGTSGDGPLVEARVRGTPSFRGAQWRCLPLAEFRALIGGPQGSPEPAGS
jgi:hypothetical protein